MQASNLEFFDRSYNFNELLGGVSQRLPVRRANPSASRTRPPNEPVAKGYVLASYILAGHEKASFGTPS